jgi:hypothetical protein
MTTLHVYSNRHIKDQVKNITKGDFVYLENGMSRKRWSRYFSVNNINEDALNITYITQEEFFELIGIKFDVIVGNPPYRDSTTKTEKGGTTLWSVITNHCINNLLKDGGTMSFVTPNAWMSFGKSGKEMKKYQLHTVDTDVAKFFPGVGSTFTSWSLEKTPVYKETYFPAENISLDLREIDSLPVGRPLQGIKIIDKVLSWSGDYLVPKIEQNPKLKGGWSKNANGFIDIDASLEKTNQYVYEVFHTNSLNYYVKDKPTDYDKVKIIVSTSSPYPKVYSSPIGCAYGDLRTYIVVDNEEVGNNILSYLNSKLFRFVWRRPGMISGKSLALPKLENKNWSNAELYKLFNLTDEEIKIVEEHAG